MVLFCFPVTLLSVLWRTDEGVEVGLASSDAGLDALEAVTSFGHVTLQTLATIHGISRGNNTVNQGINFEQLGDGLIGHDDYLSKWSDAEMISIAMAEPS